MHVHSMCTPWCYILLHTELLLARKLEACQYKYTLALSQIIYLLVFYIISCNYIYTPSLFSLWHRTQYKLGDTPRVAARIF
jgi:hypothetical protein